MTAYLLHGACAFFVLLVVAAAAVGVSAATAVAEELPAADAAEWVCVYQTR